MDRTSAKVAADPVATGRYPHWLRLLAPVNVGELREDPAAELDELAALYEAKGLSTATARTVRRGTHRS
ncbi:MAG: hypothetical protein QOH82_3691 [Mycobacterium sp.]|jgi:hypothetical protein|nr:hypothetical protein [Mycobacterium sp.]